MTERSSVFGRYRQWVEEGLAEISPYPPEKIHRLSRRIGIISFAAAAAGMILVFPVNGPGIFTFLSMAFTAYILMREIPEFILMHMRNDLYLKLPAFLSAVRKKYINLGNIPEAVKEAAKGMTSEIRLNGEEIYDILLLGNRREKVREYACKGKRNRFLRLFLIQAFETSEYGDGKGEKKDSVFAENLNILRMGITSELYGSKRTAYMFSGYMTVAVLPVIFFGMIRRMGLSFSENMGQFYESNGKTVLLTAFLAAFFIYRMVSDAGKEGNKRSTGPIYGSRLEGNNGVACGFVRKLLRETSSGESVTGIVIKSLASFAFPVVFGLAAGIGKNTYGLFTLLILGLAAGAMPVAELIYRKARNSSIMVEEIKRMQMVIMMERKLESITVVTLLSDMELFATAFAPEIRECLNNWSSGSEEALRRLKEKGRKKSSYFDTIADSFLSVDEVGIEEAFSDTDLDRESMVKIEELESTIRTEKKKDLTDLLAWLPGLVMLGGYFVIPFLKVTLEEMEELFRLVKGY